MSAEAVFDTPSGFKIALALRDDRPLIQRNYFNGEIISFEAGEYRLPEADAKIIATKILELYGLSN